LENNIVTWRLKAGIVKSEKTAIARQRRVETRFRRNEYAGINQRVTQRLIQVLMATANNKGMNCCTRCFISGRREVSSGRHTESRYRVREAVSLGHEAVMERSCEDSAVKC
jgi:hypothetical protein